MADPVVTTNTQQGISRDYLRQIFKDNPRMIKAFESLLKDVGVTLPTAIDEQAQQLTLLALIGTSDTRASSGDALSLADQVMVLEQTVNKQRSAISGLLRITEDLQAQVQTMTRQHSSAIASLRSEVADARTLIQGI